MAERIPNTFIEESDTDTATMRYLNEGTKQTNPVLHTIHTNKVCNQ